MNGYGYNETNELDVKVQNLRNISPKSNLRLVITIMIENGIILNNYNARVKYNH